MGERIKKTVFECEASKRSAGKLWHCSFPFLVHGFHLQSALNAVDQTHCSSLSCTFPYCAHCSSPPVESISSWCQDISPGYDEVYRYGLVFLSFAALLFSGSCPEGKHRDRWYLPKNLLLSSQEHPAEEALAVCGGW